MLQYQVGFLIALFSLLVAMDSYCCVVAGVVASSSSELSSESPSVGIV
jgi:hypothetical protein